MVKEDTVVSVAIASYNGETYIEEQLKSIIQQTYRVSEIVVCDDCSQDRTVQMVTDLLKDSGIAYNIILHDSNKGVVSSFFEAIRACNGEIVFLADQDDVWKPQKVEKYLSKFFEDKSCVLCFSNAELVDSSLKQMGMTLWESVRFNNKCRSRGDYVDELLKRNIFTGMSMAFRKNEILDKLLYSENMLHDEMIGWTALLYYNVASISETLALYRQHAKNVKGTRRKSFKDIDSNTKALIMESNIRFWKKFEDISDYVQDAAEIKRKVDKAADFYKWKCNLTNIGRVKGLCHIMKNVIQGSYRKYTSVSDHAFLKDLFICIS
ncbi:MAG: glycosyltransferase [Lachnospiraceae bacterium]|nr:glycosyltransferase [Lachnospiraceae bacterium]